MLLESYKRANIEIKPTLLSRQLHQYYPDQLLFVSNEREVSIRDCFIPTEAHLIYKRCNNLEFAVENGCTFETFEISLPCKNKVPHRTFTTIEEVFSQHPANRAEVRIRIISLSLSPNLCVRFHLNP